MTMPETTTTNVHQTFTDRPATDFDTRRTALDRAIDYAHNCTHGDTLGPDRVLEIAHQFEQYLANPDA